MFYRRFMTKADRDRIVAEGATSGQPHCNPKTLHEPGVCAFCDAYYAAGGEHPDEYATPEANGWGGNQAPIVDDEKAAEEQRQWEEALRTAKTFRDALDFHTRFHAKDGWYFERMEDGSVRLSAPDSMGPGASQVVVLDADTWASAVASVSLRGDTGETFRQALDFHNELA